jgi:hypothetical protein
MMNSLIPSREHLRLINSATKYPSIPTYHKLDPTNGGLLEETVEFPYEADVIGTEKIDGTNSRIVILPDATWLLASREELLTHSNDLVYNPALGIVEALRPVAESMTWTPGDRIITFYLELYGGTIGQHCRQYTANKRNVGWRLFDVATFEYSAITGMTPEQVAGWRDRGGPEFFREGDLRQLAQTVKIPLVPRVFDMPAAKLPTSVESMDEFLKRYLPKSRSILDDTAGGNGEGVVLRTPSRSVIAKARFEDYRRTLRRRNSGAGKAK